MDAKKNKNLILEAEKIINDHMLHMLLQAERKTRRSGREAHSVSNQKTPFVKSAHAPANEKALKTENTNSVTRSYAANSGIDYVSAFIAVSLVISSILFGFVVHGVLFP